MLQHRHFSRLYVIGLMFLVAVGTITVNAQEIVTLRVLIPTSELRPDEIAQFETENPNIKIDLLDWASMYSLATDVVIASNDLDVLRVDSAFIQQYVEDGLVLDLTPYFEADGRIQIDDLATAANYFEFDGRYYGLPKDWSPAFTLWVRKSAFESIDLPLPSTTQPLTYAELAELASQLTVTDADGVRSGFFSFSLERTITSVLVQRDLSVFDSDFTSMHWTDNPQALEVLRLFYDMALTGSMHPYTEDIDAANAIIGGNYPFPIMQYGYWLGATIEQESPDRSDLMMIPAPTWDRALARTSPTAAPIGISIAASTEHPDEAYRFFEWYIAGEAGIARTRQGWGVPPLFSMIDRLPQSTAFDRQRLDVLRLELRFSDRTLPVYPYKSITASFIDSWNRNIDLARAGQFDFDIFASNLQEEINLAILGEQLGQ